MEYRRRISRAAGASPVARGVPRGVAPHESTKAPDRGRVARKRVCPMRDILVVDDDARIRRLIAATLSVEGYGVRTAVNGQEALARIADSSPDLVLIDLQMPVL